MVPGDLSSRRVIVLFVYLFLVPTPQRFTSWYGVDLHVTMAAVSAFWLPLVAALFFATLATAQNCTCTGLDYTDGGSYLIDGSSDLPFTFHSVFEGRLA